VERARGVLVDPACLLFPFEPRMLLVSSWACPTPFFLWDLVAVSVEGVPARIQPLSAWGPGREYAGMLSLFIFFIHTKRRLPHICFRGMAGFDEHVTIHVYGPVHKRASVWVFGLTSPCIARLVYCLEGGGAGVCH